jgi:hypothetical protein
MVARSDVEVWNNDVVDQSWAEFTTACWNSSQEV